MPAGDAATPTGRARLRNDELTRAAEEKDARIACLQDEIAKQRRDLARVDSSARRSLKAKTKPQRPKREESGSYSEYSYSSEYSEPRKRSANQDRMQKRKKHNKSRAHKVCSNYVFFVKQ